MTAPGGSGYMSLRADWPSACIFLRQQLPNTPSFPEEKEKKIPFDILLFFGHHYTALLHALAKMSGRALSRQSCGWPITFVYVLARYFSGVFSVSRPLWHDKSQWGFFNRRRTAWKSSRPFCHFQVNKMLENVQKLGTYLRDGRHLAKLSPKKWQYNAWRNVWKWAGHHEWQ